MADAIRTIENPPDAEVASDHSGNYLICEDVGRPRFAAPAGDSDEDVTCHRCGRPVTRRTSLMHMTPVCFLCSLKMGIWQ